MTDVRDSDLKVLCCMTHFYAQLGSATNAGLRKSESQAPELRREYINNSLRSCRAIAELPQVSRLESLVCGKPGLSLVPLDVALEEPESRNLVYATIEYMVGRRDEFDYYILVEDDIIVPPQVLQNVIAFDRVSLLNEALHPNRLETRHGQRFNTDLRARSAWTVNKRSFDGHLLGVNANPHSAIFVLSREKFNYCAQHVDLTHRGALGFGGFDGGFMASAFANFLGPMVLYRPYETVDYHYVIHQDPFEWRAPTPYDRFSAVVHSILPPIVVSALRAAKRRVRGNAH